MRKFFKDKKIYFINSIIVLSLFILTLLINKISPFGNNMLSKSDSIVIFKPMLYDFITKLRSGTLLAFSFNNGLGNPTIFNVVYCLSSPLNLIAIPFKTPDAMYLSTVLLKLLVGSITMTYYVKSKTDNNFIIFIATISYIFSSWFLTYYYYLPWLDIFVFFPLFQKGLEDLLDKKKFNTYIIGLALVTISHFYLAFPVYVYTLIYFIVYELFYKKDDKKEKLLKFNIITLSTIVSFVLIFFFVYFIFDAFIKTGINFGGHTANEYTIGFIDFIKSFFYGNQNFIVTMSGKTFPNYACNTFIFINVLFFFFNKNIEKRTKIFTAIGVLLVLGAFFIKQFDFVLKFFHQIRGLTYRYTFIIEILIIKMFITNLTTIKKEDIKKMLLTIPIIVILFAISFKSMEFNIRIFTICSLVAYTIVLFLYSDNKIHKLLICLLVTVQSLIASSILIPANLEKETFASNHYQKENVKYRLNDFILDVDGKYNNFINNNLYYNSKVISLLSPMTYNNVYYLSRNLGCEIYENTYYACQKENEFFTLLFNVKTDDYYLEKIYTVNSYLKLADSGIDTSIKENYEKIIASMTGITDIYETVTLKGKVEDDKYVYETKYPYYLIDIYNEDGTTSTVPQTYSSFNIEKEYGKEQVNIYVPRQSKLTQIYQKLAENQIEYTYYNDDHLEGDINVDTGKIIFTSIPYDESWEIKVDGKKVKPIILLDSLLGIETDPGKHHISLKYKNTNYIAPTIISIITLIGYIIFNIKRKN